MSAIERCRAAAVAWREKCAHSVIAYNGCRNRHCPKCQGAELASFPVVKLTSAMGG